MKSNKSNKQNGAEGLVPYRLRRRSMSPRLQNYVAARSKVLNKSEGEIIVELAMRRLGN